MIQFTLLGEPASKANSRKLVTINGHPAFIKSAKARSFEVSAVWQIPHHAQAMLEGPVGIRLHIYYATERPDLDESVVLDVLQAKYTKKRAGKRLLLRRGVYINDRQVREKHVFHHIDRANPRTEVEVWPLVEQALLPFEVELAVKMGKEKVPF